MVARAVGGAGPLARPETQTAWGCTAHKVARTRRGARPTTQTARAARRVGPTRRSHARAARESQFGGFDVLVGLGAHSRLVVGVQRVVGVL
eukprot:10976563-Alexandrium_andersonii.AAC.1